MWCGSGSSPRLRHARLCGWHGPAKEWAKQGAASSIDVRLVATGGLEFGDEIARGGPAHLAGFGRDVREGRLHVLGHALGISADIEVGSGLKPAPQLRSRLQHAVLHVNLGTLARPGERKTGQRAIAEKAVELVAVEEILRLALMAEEQPGAALCACRPAVEEEGAKWGDAGPRTDHDDWPIAVRRQRKPVRLLDVDLDALTGIEPIGEQRRGDPKAPSPRQLVA